MSDETSKTRRVTLRKEIAGLIWLALGLFLLLCLVSFNQGDPSWNTSIKPDEISNLGGVVGAYLADVLFQSFGLPALLLPLACFLVAWRLLRMREVRFRLQRTLAFFALLLSLAGLLALRFKEIPLYGSTLDEAGGAAGRILVHSLSSLLNITGTAIVLSVFFLVSLMLSTRFSLVLFLSDRLDRLGRGIEQRRDQRAARRQQKAKEKGERLEKGPVIAQPVPHQQTSANDSSKKKNKKKKDGPDQQEHFEFLEPTGTYHRPSLSLLDHDGGPPPVVDRESLTANARLLENKLKDFGVEG